MTMEHHHDGNAGPMTPLHPAVVHFPIALAVLSVGADAFGWALGSRAIASSLFAAGWLALGGATVSAVVAIALGIRDMRQATIAEEVHKHVHHHMRVGFSVFGALALLFTWRMSQVLAGHAAVGLVYLLAGAAILALVGYQGWLGGELVFRYRVGVSAVPDGGMHDMASMQGAAATKGASEMQNMAGMKDATGMKDTPGMKDMPGMQHGATSQPGGEPRSQPPVSRTQLVVLTGVSFLALFAGLYVPAVFMNFSLSAESVRGAIMPPGMITTPDSPADAMRDMAAADPRLVTYNAPADARGDRPLAPRMEGGVKVFDMDASVIRWNILSWKTVTAYAINQQVPGPRLELTEGDHIRINFTNHLPDSATMHWHGLVVPNAMDGPAHITQAPVPPGGRYVYEYVVQQSGSYFYHSHMRPDRQQAFGLYGALIVHPRDSTIEPRADIDYVVQLQEWLNRDGLTYPAMLMEGALPNYFTINGKSYPATDVIHMKVGQRVKFRIIGTNNNFIHPMHMHGGPFSVVARDGVTLAPAARFDADVINVGPGQRYDVIWPARVAGKWIFHCHIAHHTLNNNTEEQGGGGLTLLVDVAP
jgi:FtsP/CotA-like multicopper oxidase with cupredoxin domain/uncharacterized membrane protein